MADGAEVADRVFEGDYDLVEAGVLPEAQAAIIAGDTVTLLAEAAASGRALPEDLRPLVDMLIRHGLIPLAALDSVVFAQNAWTDTPES